LITKSKHLSQDLYAINAQLLTHKVLESTHIYLSRVSKNINFLKSYYSQHDAGSKYVNVFNV